MIDTPILIPLFFLTALVYSMAGFGGGSTYLALMVLFAVPFETMRSVALLCNIAVVGFGSWHFARKGHLSLKRVLPLVVTSIPMACLGGTIRIGQELFALLLGISLCVAALKIFLTDKTFESRISLSSQNIWGIGLPAGAVLGFLSGLVGIGGGIYLAPFLLLSGWADSKQTAAASSLFILVNSVAGLMGQWGTQQGAAPLPWDLILPLLSAVVLGGQIGTRLGAGKIPKLMLQRVSTALILWASGRLLWGLL